jgi:hypothetical protein
VTVSVKLHGPNISNELAVSRVTHQRQNSGHLYINNACLHDASGKSMRTTRPKCVRIEISTVLSNVGFHELRAATNPKVQRAQASIFVGSTWVAAHANRVKDWPNELFRQPVASSQIRNTKFGQQDSLF